MRHAQAGSDAQSDARRPLTDAGHDQARIAGGWLAERGVRPTAALVSAALRTQQTWADVASAAGFEVEPELSEALYAAGSHSAVDLIHGIPDTERSLVVVGHNPTMGTLASLLDDGDGDPEAEQAILAGGFAPSSIAVFEVDGPWQELDQGGARLVAYRSGR